MDSFAKIFSNADILFFIVLVETVIIVILVGYIAYLLWGVEERKEDSGHVTEDFKKKVKESNGWRDAYYETVRQLNQLKNEKNNWQNSQGVSMNQRGQRWFDNKRDETESRNPSHDSFEDYAAREREKGVWANGSMNDSDNDKSEERSDYTDEKPASFSMSPKFEFLEAANGGQFRKLLPSDEKCFFRTWEENGIRKFEFHGNVDKALANINAIFDDVCEIEGKQNGATNIVNVEPGILDSKLKVEKPAKIQLT